jgi:undecaprenyl-phosphate 4-deoxy-4-formamido-L-arabinose transferase
LVIAPGTSARRLRTLQLQTLSVRGLSGEKTEHADHDADERRDTAEQGEKPLFGQEIERRQHEPEFQKALSHIEPQSALLLDHTLLLFAPGGAFKRFCLRAVLVTIDHIAFGKLAHTVALAAQRRRKPGGHVKQVFTQLLRLIEGPLIVRFSLGDYRRRMRPMRPDRDHRQNDAYHADGNPDTPPKRVVRMLMFCMDFNFRHVSPAEAKNSAILSRPRYNPLTNSARGRNILELPKGELLEKPPLSFSIVIPVYNEESSLPGLFARLYPVLDGLGVPYECVFIDDGSRDRSVALLRAQHAARPAETRVVILQRNFGQHAAIMAGFERAQGDAVITLDADLQNPPEEIPRLIAAIREGHDYVGTVRRGRQDHWARRWLSRAINALRNRTTSIRITDQGCMLRAYGRDVVDAVNVSHEVNTFIPALGYLYARDPTEIEVAHEPRRKGESKYSLYSLIRLNFDLMTGFSVVPLQLFSMLGMVIAGFSGLLVLLLLARRLILGPEVEGVFTLFALVFFLIGIALFGIGLIGEYVGRTYEQVRGRPRFIVAAVLDTERAVAVREQERV